MDPKLAARFARQQAKEEAGEAGAFEVAEIGSVANTTKQLDPVLAKRWAKQKEREETGNASVEEIGSIATVQKKIDPLLAKRWDKLQSGELPVEAIDQIGSIARKESQIDPMLAKRWDKLQSGEVPVKEIGSAAQAAARALDPKLAEAFARQQEREEAENGLADGKAEDDDGTGEDPDEARSRSDSATRTRLSLPAGKTCTHTVEWAAGTESIRWSAVVLDGLNIDLEVLAKLRPDASCGNKDSDAIVLQKFARGETFVQVFCPARDRRLAVATKATEEEGGVDRREVEAILFKFSNSFSWLTAKEVELVTLVE